MVKVKIVVENSQGASIDVFDEDVETLGDAERAAKVLNCAVLLEAALKGYWEPGQRRGPRGE